MVDPLSETALVSKIILRESRFQPRKLSGLLRVRHGESVLWQARRSESLPWQARCPPAPQPRWLCYDACFSTRKENEQNEGVTRLVGKPKGSFVSLVIFRSKSRPHSAALSAPKAFASHYRLNAINFRSLRRCVKASPAIPSAPPIHVLGSGTGAAAVNVRTMSLPA